MTLEEMENRSERNSKSLLEHYLEVEDCLDTPFTIDELRVFVGSFMGAFVPLVLKSGKENPGEWLMMSLLTALSWSRKEMP